MTPMPAIHIKSVKFEQELLSYLDLKVFKPSLPADWYYLGVIATSESIKDQEGLIVQAGEKDALADVVDWKKVGPNNDPEPPPPFSTWRGSAPLGYVVVGDFVVLGNDKPTAEQTVGIKAIREDIVACLKPQRLVWTGKQPWSVVTLWDYNFGPLIYIPTGAFVSNDDHSFGDREIAVVRVEFTKW